MFKGYLINFMKTPWLNTNLRQKKEKEILENLTYKHLQLLMNQNWLFIKMQSIKA